MTHFTERQAHGFTYEQEVIKRYGLEREDNYTSKWDAYYQGIPVSIKTCTKKGVVYMGDFVRNATLTHNFILIIGFWENDSNGLKVFDDDIILYINRDVWVEQFPPGISSKMLNIFEGITNSEEDNAKWKVKSKAYNQEWDDCQTGIKINFKRDHKKQKRIQCSIRRWFMEDVLIPFYQTTLDSIYINEEGK